MTGGKAVVFQYFNQNMDEITTEELVRMELWNPTMEHIFAQTMKKIEEGKITVEPQIVSGLEL